MSNRSEDISVPRWALENIEDALRIQYRIDTEDRKKTGETCQDRNIRQSLIIARKLLAGVELTGGERFEQLKAQY